MPADFIAEFVATDSTGYQITGKVIQSRPLKNRHKLDLPSTPKTIMKLKLENAACFSDLDSVEFYLMGVYVLKFKCRVSSWYIESMDGELYVYKAIIQPLSEIEKIEIDHQSTIH